MTKLGVFILIFTLFAGISRGQNAPAANPLSENYYERLGVSTSASMDEIKKAHRKLMWQYHTDRNPNADRAYSQNINEAGKVLKNETARRNYDAKLSREANSQFNQNYTADYERSTEISQPPPGWMENINAYWNNTQSYEMNLMRNLAVVRPQGRAYLYGLIGELRWVQNGKVAIYFRTLGEMFIQRFNGLDRNKMAPAEFLFAQNKIDSLMFLPEAAYFPDLIDMLLMGPHANYVVEVLLLQPHWRNHPYTGHWLSMALANKSPAVTMALVEKFLPTLESSSSKKAFLKMIIAAASDAGLEVLSKRFPVSDSTVDYREELELLLTKRNAQAAKIFRTLRSLEAADMCQELF